MVPGELVAVVPHSGLLMPTLLCMTLVLQRLQSIMHSPTCSEAGCLSAHIITSNLVLPELDGSPRWLSRQCC